MITYLLLRYKDQEYKFPIGTNILTGKLLRKLIKKFMYETIHLEKYSRIWLGEHYLSDDSIFIYDVDRIVLFTNQWGVSEEDGLFIPSIITKDIRDMILTIE